MRVPVPVTVPVTVTVPSFSLSLLLSIISLLLLSPAAAVDCDCYETSTHQYFTNHIFHDFRSLPGVSASATPSLPSGLPPTLTPTQADYASQADLGVQQAGWIQSNAWTDFWGIMNWGKVAETGFPVRMQNSWANVYLENDDVDVNATSKLVLRTHRFPTFQSAAEVESDQKNLFYASLRIRARVHGAPGAVAGLFIFQNDQNESDIEILTRDLPAEIRYSNQPVVDAAGNEIVGASTSVNLATGAQLDGSLDPDILRRGGGGGGSGGLPGARWDQWHTYRLDWVSGRNSWFVDGLHYLDKKYGVPSVPSYLVLNMWSDGGVWAGNMTVGQSAFLDISYVEMVFNTSGAITGYTGSKAKAKREKKPGCRNVCVVDGVDVVGTPQTKVAAAGRNGVCVALLVGVLVGAVMVVVAV